MLSMASPSFIFLFTIILSGIGHNEGQIEPKALYAMRYLGDLSSAKWSLRQRTVS